MITIDMRTDSDCVRCCLAMVLGLGYSSVPDFVADHNNWLGAMGEWLAERGIGIVRVQATDDGELLHTQSLVGDGVPWIASGPAERGHNHAVVYRGPKQVHDPHASRAGLLSISAALVLVPWGL